MAVRMKWEKKVKIIIMRSISMNAFHLLNTEMRTPSLSSQASSGINTSAFIFAQTCPCFCKLTVKLVPKKNLLVFPTELFQSYLPRNT